jgi:beta-mannosidase
VIREELTDQWRLRAPQGPVPDGIRAGHSVSAQVPGSVHLDLLAAGVIPDPFLDCNERDLAWMHRTDWEYSTEFRASTVQPGERVDLVFDGIDTVATVRLNDRVLGNTANMHRSHRFDVTDALRPGDSNHMVVEVAPALTYAESVEGMVGWRERAYPHPYNAIRKMACSFGWDWGPDLQTAGIWKPVRLERWDAARLAEVRPLVTVDPDHSGRIEVRTRLERARPADCTIVVRVDGVEERAVVSGDEATLTVVVPQARLWWPVGYGDQPLYELEVTLEVDGRPVDTYRRRVGFRTVTVDTGADEHGSRFTFIINGTPIFAKGANWIPDDHFLTRIDRARLARRVDQAVDAHMNMLRVWGGGIYETEDFYDVCDERGVLVWQDFLFACAFYTEDEPLRGEIEAEAREQISRLTPHPSLVLWNGNNENLVAYTDWPGWQERLAGRSWGLGYYQDLLPALLAELDPTRPYAPGSPYSPGEVAPNDAGHGTRHEWDVWNRVDYAHYRDQIPRFCAEFGFQGPPTWTTLTRWIHDQPMTPRSPGFLAHQKAYNGNENLGRGMAPHLAVPEDFEDWHWAAQLNQARAVAVGVEHFRSWWPRTAGALVWQLNDCWPATSWAAIDSDERPKPLYYALQHAFAPRLLTLQPRDGELVLMAVNDSDDPWQAEALTKRQTFAGEPLAVERLPFTVAARSVALIPLPASLLTPDDPAREALTITTPHARVYHLFCEDRDAVLDPDPLVATVSRVRGGYRIDASATSFAHDVSVLADKVAPDATVDDMLVSLAAGESTTFQVRTAVDVPTPSDLVSPRVLRCANRLSTGGFRDH